MPSSSSTSAARFIVGQPDAFSRLAATFGSTPLDTVKAWMAFRGFVQRTEDLPVGFLVRGACKRWRRSTVGTMR